MGAGKSFKEGDWDKIVNTITDVYAQTLPADLRNWKPALDASFDQVNAGKVIVICEIFYVEIWKNVLSCHLIIVTTAVCCNYVTHLWQ